MNLSPEIASEVQRLTALHGQLSVEMSQITYEYMAWFGDYDEGTRTGWGNTREQAVEELINLYEEQDSE